MNDKTESKKTDNAYEIRKFLSKRYWVPEYDDLSKALSTKKAFFDKGIVELNNVQVDAFDVVPNEEYGHREKLFCRLSVNAFPGLVKELKTNPRCSYKSCINDLILADQKPEFVSAVIMENSSIVNQIVASKILNYFEIPVAYYSAIFVDKQPLLATVDFLNKDEILELFSDNEITNKAVWSVFEWDTREVVDIVHKRFLTDDYKVDITRLKEALVYSYFVRNLIIGDYDNCAQNNGFILNTKTHVASLAPQFDLEGAFYGLNERDFNDFSEDIDSIKKYFPSVYNKFKEKLFKLNNAKIDELLSTKSGEDLYFCQDKFKNWNVGYKKILNNLKSNIDNFVKYVSFNDRVM